MRIDHILLAMPEGEEARARAFFVEVVGMEEEPKPSSLLKRGGCWFRSGQCSIHVGADPDFLPQRKAHPAFAIRDLDALAERLAAAGFAVQWDDRLPGVERFYTDDPFGNRLEFLRESEND